MTTVGKGTVEKDLGWGRELSVGWGEGLIFSKGEIVGEAAGKTKTIDL